MFFSPFLDFSHMVSRYLQAYLMNQPSSPTVSPYPCVRSCSEHNLYWATLYSRLWWRYRYHWSTTCDLWLLGNEWEHCDPWWQHQAKKERKQEIRLQTKTNWKWWYLNKVSSHSKAWTTGIPANNKDVTGYSNSSLFSPFYCWNNLFWDYIYIPSLVSFNRSQLPKDIHAIPYK